MLTKTVTMTAKHGYLFGAICVIETTFNIVGSVAVVTGLTIRVIRLQEDAGGPPRVPCRWAP